MDGAYASRCPRLRPCGPATQYSFFFNLIAKLFPEKWGMNKPLHRACSLARKLGVTHLAAESLQPNQEIREEQEAMTRRIGRKVRVKATRITFFRTDRKHWRDASSEEYLGYVVLLKYSLPRKRVLVHVLESVMRTPTLFLEGNNGLTEAFTPGNYYAHCTREFPTLVGTRKDHNAFVISGSFFCQQNGLTQVCAHAALRMALNSSPALANVSKLTNEHINRSLGIDHKQTVLKRGLTSQEIQRVLISLGLNSHHADFHANLRTGYPAFIYPLVDSQLPVILGIEARNVQHVVAVLGHTMNSDRWAPEARQGYGCYPISPFIPSPSWADHFLINDDNLGMNITLPTEAVQNFIVPRLNPNLHVTMAIGVVPQKTSLPGSLAEESAARLMFDILLKTNPSPANRWLQHLTEIVARAEKAIDEGRSPLNTFVCRTLLAKKTDYLSHVGRAVDSNGNRLQDYEREFLRNWLPDRFWLTEITLPDLYTANKHKLGDAISITNPDRDQVLNRETVVFLWLPGIAFWRSGQWNPAQWSLSGHIPLFRFGNKRAPPLEW